MKTDLINKNWKKTQSMLQSEKWIFLNKIGPFLGLAFVFGLFTALNPKIISLTALETMVQQTVIVGIAAIGMTMVIISGGIDLSTGSIIAFSSVTSAWLMVSQGLPPSLAACGGVLAGVLAGSLNGFIITRFKLVPFIVTLGTLLVVRGMAKGLANSMPINTGESWLGDLLATLPNDQKWQLIPPGAWLMILFAVLVAGLLRYTQIGRYIFAIGSNEQTARLCGIAIERVKLIVYAIMGFFSGLAGIMLMSYQGQGDPTAAMGMELDIIAATVIGGGSLSGGEGSILGSLVGAMIMTVIRTGCQLNGWPTWVTQVVTGSVIVMAVAFDRLRHK